MVSFQLPQHADSAMNASVFVATSLDGFIARANDDLDWLPRGGGEEHGYDAFMTTVDALVIGRRTFEKVLTFSAWPYHKQPVFVLSTRALVPAPSGAVVKRMSEAPGEIVSQLAAPRRAAYSRGWRDHHPAVSPGRAHSAPHYHTHSRAHRFGDPALRRVTGRHRIPTRHHPPVLQRARAK